MFWLKYLLAAWVGSVKLVELLSFYWGQMQVMLPVNSSMLMEACPIIKFKV